MRHSQGLLPFPRVLSTYRPEDFVIGRANNDAVTMLCALPHLPAPGIFIYGAADSGKTHLLHWFAKKHGIPVFSNIPPPDALPTIVALDNLDSTQTTEALYALFLETTGRKIPVIAAGRQPPSLWQGSTMLPDALSRLKALSTVELLPPDETLLATLLVKLFADRQINVTPDLITYMTTRMDRSYAGATTLVADFDAYTLQQHLPLTIPSARHFFATRKLVHA